MTGSRPANGPTDGQRSQQAQRLQISAGTWISCRKGRMIYRGRLLLDHDSATKPDVQITSDVASEGYRHLMAPVEIHIVGKTVIR
jgi:hypothetical protein